LTLPFSALGALIAALIDTTVLPEWRIGGASANLVLTLAIVAAITVSVEDGLTWAVVGGLLVDILTPARPIGATTLTLLLVVGMAIVAGHIASQQRRATAIMATFALTWVYQALLLTVLAFVVGVSFGSLDRQLPVIAISAIINSLIALPAVLAVGALARRFAISGRATW
jgi:rod shape-determining protein MreD